MPREEETIRSVGPESWPADPDERIRLAREATLAARAPYVAAEEKRSVDP